MLKALLHRIFSVPLIYDLLQTLVGARYIRSRLQKSLTGIVDGAIIVDVGGGTGLNRSLFGENIRYICLDNDPVKLQGVLQKMVDGHPLLGDAGNIAIQTNSVDMVICTSVTHHLPDELLSEFFREAMRILKPTGKFVVLDAVWSPKRWASRILWRYDRGSFPRPLETLRQELSRHGKLTHWDEFAVFHRYVIGIVNKNEAL
jgi:ubiquinone/menaquinone biosynthesis C-methylase UbiE